MHDCTHKDYVRHRNVELNKWTKAPKLKLKLIILHKKQQKYVFPKSIICQFYFEKNKKDSHMLQSYI